MIRSRLTRVVQATRHVLRKPRLTGAELERLVGHWTYLLLVRREALALFGHVYDFIRRSYTRRQPLWPGVRRELRWAIALAPLLVADLRAPRAPLIIAVDASPWGYGAVEAAFPPPVVGDIGRVRERWRMKLLPAGMRVFRETALLELEAFDYGGDAGGAVAHVGWREVPAAVQRSPDWRVICARRWRQRASIHELEAHALAWAVRRRARVRASQGQRWLFLSDNMSVVLAVATGRAASWPLLSACRHLTALAFALSARIYVRWIASEGNPAD